MKIKDWWVLEKDGEFYAIEDTNCLQPRMVGAIVVGIGAFKLPKDAIEHFAYIEANKSIRRKKE
jgi:hypothetical protein